MSPQRSNSPYDDLLDTCAPLLRPRLLVIEGEAHARVGLAAPTPLIDASRATGKAAVLTIRTIPAPVRDCPLAGSHDR